MKLMKVNDSVVWDSQAGGYMTTKRGKIVRVIASRHERAPIHIAAEEFPEHQRMFDGMNTPGLIFPSYLVEVAPTGPRAKPRLYMPYTSKLKLASEECSHTSE